MDDVVDTYMLCRSIGRMTTKVFDYIQPRASAKSAAAGSVPRRSARLNLPPPTPTPSVPPPAALPATPETEEEWMYDDDIELDIDFPKAAPTAPTAPKPMFQATRINKGDILLFPADPSTPPPDVFPCDTPNWFDSLQGIISNKIYHLFGNRRFRNYKHFVCTSKDANFFQWGGLCPSIGEFYNLRKQALGKALAPTNHYLNKVHLYIIFGCIIIKLGYRYSILLINRATKYIWFYGVKSLVSECIIEALEQFRANAGSLPKQFRCDCDQKLLRVNACRWIYLAKSNIIGAPAGRQSANRLAKHAWATV